MLVDFHAHILPPSFGQRREDYQRRDATFASLFGGARTKVATAEVLIAAMDGAEVDVAVVMGFGWSDRQTATEANDYILEQASRYQGRLVGMCSVNPLWGEDALREIERCTSAGARGVGELHPDTQGYDISDHCVMAPLMELCQELDLLVLTHTSEPVGHIYPGKGRTTPEKVYSFIGNFPENKVVCAHWGGGLPFYGLMPEVRETMANVYFDTAASPLLYDSRIYSQAPSLIGADKVLFGTDFPLVTYRRALEQVEQSMPRGADRTRQLGDNAAALLGL